MFKTYDQAQNFLIPPSFLDFLGEWHEAIVLSEIIDALDFKTLLSSYSNSERGTTAYHPVMLVKVLFYGYMNRVFSSRKLAAKTKTDFAFMFLAACNQPDFRTISRFRKEKGGLLAWVFVQIVQKAQELWLISFGVVSIDGTKVYADASKNRNYDLATLEKQMKKLLEEAEDIDAIDDKKWGEDDDGSGVPPELRTREGREKKRQEIEAKSKKLEDKNEMVQKEIENKQKEGIAMKRINATDPDSRLMQMKRKDWWNGYNPQLATENQIIIATTLNNAASDINELIPVLKTIQESYQIQPKKVLADKWYASEQNYDYLEEQGIDGYIPHPKLQGKLSGNMEGWNYAQKKDEYTDPEGNIYTFKHFSCSKTKRGRGRPKLSQPITESDFRAKMYQTKTKEGKNKFLKISKNWIEHCKKQDQKLSTEEGKELYKKRWCSVEPVFWNIKRNLWFERFFLRWLEWVKIEWNLITMVHNLKKIMQIKPV